MSIWVNTFPFRVDNYHVNLAIFRKHVSQKLLVISGSNLVETLLKVGALNICLCWWRHFRSRPLMEWNFLSGLTILFNCLPFDQIVVGTYLAGAKALNYCLPEINVDNMIIIIMFLLFLAPFLSWQQDSE